MRVGGGIYNYPGALTFLIYTQNLYKENHTKPHWQARGGEHCESLPGLTGSEWPPHGTNASILHNGAHPTTTSMGISPCRNPRTFALLT